MKLKNNSTQGLKQYFFNELHDIYPKEELQSLYFYGLESCYKVSKLAALTQNQQFTESELLYWMRYTKHLKAEQPPQYFFGKAAFDGLELEVNSNVLIPRPETEELISIVCNSIFNTKKIKVLDVGTGSGCIAIALKKRLPQAAVYALDVSHEALELAKKNALKNKADIQFIHSSIFDFDIDDFDCIVSNPPYILEKEKSEMPKNVLFYEPHLALFVKDDDAIVFYKTIFNKFKLAKYVFFEGNHLTLPLVLAESLKHDFLKGKIKRDLNGKWRFAILNRNE